MNIIKNFLYDGLTYKINTGFTPIVVNNQTMKVKVKVPNVQWRINFGNVKNDMHNFIDKILHTSDNDLFLATHIFPTLKLYKVTGGAVDFYTYRYLFEEEYYGASHFDVTTRKITFTNDGTYDILDNSSLTVKVSDIGNLEIGTDRFPHFVHYLSNSLGVKHVSNSVFDLTATVSEYFDPTSTTDITDTITYVGASNASDSGLL